MENVIYNLSTVGLGTDDVMFAILLSIGIYLVVAELRDIAKSLLAIRGRLSGIHDRLRRINEK
jgi:hypothetical protein